MTKRKALVDVHLKTENLQKLEDGSPVRLRFLHLNLLLEPLPVVHLRLQASKLASLPRTITVFSCFLFPPKEEEKEGGELKDDEDEKKLGRMKRRDGGEGEERGGERERDS